MTETPWGPTGQLVYERTYSRTKPNGEKETWPETVERVVDGNLNLVPAERTSEHERDRLIDLIGGFDAVPAGRHLWASGVSGRQYLFNCHVSGWSNSLTDHFEFTFLRLMEGGGVGANYSNRHLGRFAPVQGPHEVHIVCDPEHPDFELMHESGILSAEYGSDWPGAHEVEDSREGWANALVDLLSTYYRDAQNTNRVFDVSRVRGQGARLKSFGGTASGPLPLGIMLDEVATVMNRHRDTTLTGMAAMEIDHAIAQCVVSGGNRRSARMAIMHWLDPEIETFLKCKEQTGKHWTTNISVEVDDQFWCMIDNEDSYAHEILRNISNGMLGNGEPGIWDSGYSNIGEPNPVMATNPCGEIALESWENCNLGHINLSAFVRSDGQSVDWNGLSEAHRLMTRFLIRATYGDVQDDKQAAVLNRNRRIGVGHFGFASMLAKLGIRYSDAPDTPWVGDFLHAMAGVVDDAAFEYAHDLRIPVPVKSRTVAPTGTIAKLPGASEGIHPIFAKYFLRRIRMSNVDLDQVMTLQEYADQGYTVEPCLYARNTSVVEIPTQDNLMSEVSAIHGAEMAERLVQSPEDLTLRDMLRVQAMYQGTWADNAVSYTANVDPGRYSVDEVADVLADIGPELKGMTIFPETSLPQAPYARMTRIQFESYRFGDVSDGIDENCASGACPVR